MKKRIRALLVPVVAVALAVSACGEDDPMGGGGDTPPPDLSGTYSLQSFSSPLTGGVSVGPPVVSGTFTLLQTDVDGGEATGTFDVDLLLPDGAGGQMPFQDTGTFTVRSDGTWEQSGQIQQGLGTWTLVGSTLTVIVTDPAQAAGTTVWLRQ